MNKAADVPGLIGVFVTPDGEVRTMTGTTLIIYTTELREKWYEYHRVNNYGDRNGRFIELLIEAWYRNYYPSIMYYKVIGGKRGIPHIDNIEFYLKQPGRYGQKRVFWKEDERGIRYLDRRLKG